MLHGVSLVGYDPVKRCLVARDCMSDGSSSVAEFTIQGRVRKDNITITSKTGEILLARVAGEYSRDWKRLEATWEGSTDNGKTWQHWCSLVSEKTGDGDNDEQELIKLYDKLLTAAFKRDLQVIERALADDISIGTSEGKYITKEDILNLVSSDKFDLVSASNEDLKAKIFGNMAVVTGKFNWANEKGENGQEIFIDTFSKRDGRWQMVASHASKVTEQDNTEKNKVVLGRVFDEVFNAGKLDAIDEIYDEDFVSHMPGDSTHAGLARLKNMVAGIRKRMPDYHEDLKTMCVEGDFAACRWISTGTDGNSGKKFSFPCLSMYRFKDGKIIEQWILPDLEARKQSLGQ